MRARLLGEELVAEPPVAVRACPGGPWLVRGASEVVDDAGESHRTRRPVVAVCACRRTQRAPWCDGTHKVVRRAQPSADDSASPTSSPSA